MKIHIALSVRGLPGSVVFKQTPTPFDVPSNWPGVKGGFWFRNWPVRF